MGFIKLDRDIQNWQWYKDGNTFRLFVHCIIKANWCDGKFKGEVIPRGSFVTSLDSLSSELGITIQQTKTAIKHLVDCEYITSKSTNKYRIITVLNYDERQGINWQVTNNQQVDNKQNNRQITSQQQTSNKQLTTIEEVKEVLEDKESFITTNKGSEDEPYWLAKENAKREQIENEKKQIYESPLLDLFEQEFARPISQRETMRLSELASQFEDKLIRYALREAILHDVKSLDYVERVLWNWKNEKMTVERYEELHS